MSKSEDIDRVRRQEQRRGKRPLDVEMAAQQKQTLADMAVLIQVSDEGEFRSLLVSALGLRLGSEPIERALQIWREFHGLG